MSSSDSAIEYLVTTRIGEKGQLTVPKQFRDDLGLDTGAPFAVLRIGDALLLLPEQRRFERLGRQINATLAAAGVTEEAVLSTLPQARKRVFERRYRTSKRARKPGARS